MRLNKILIFALTIVFTMSAFAINGLIGRSVSLNADGTIKDSVIEKISINVINRYGSSLSSGDVVVWETVEDDGASVTASQTAGDFPACILLESCADDALCECLIYGKTSVNFDASDDAATAGERMYIAETGAPGKVTGKAVGSADAGDTPIGIFLDAATTTSSVEAMILL